MARRAAKKDGNQKTNDAYLEAVGLHVLDLSRAGDGTPDALVAGYNRHTGHEMQVLVEWKVRGGELTPKEKKFLARWPISQRIVTTDPDDVLRWFGLID